MPELIEPEDPDGAAAQIVSLQEIPGEDEDVEAHNANPVGGSSMSATSVYACC